MAAPHDQLRGHPARRPFNEEPSDSGEGRGDLGVAHLRRGAWAGIAPGGLCAPPGGAPGTDQDPRRADHEGATEPATAALPATANIIAATAVEHATAERRSGCGPLVPSTAGSI